jgi:translation initiation factor IF-3
VVDENQGLVGVMPTYEALRLAEERSVDLVEIAPTANPPVCKLMDFGAFKYRQEKTERKQRLGQKKVEVKGVRISLKIGQHDLDHRINLSRKFLESGDKVRLEMILRGRELQHQDLARKKITDFITAIGIAKIESPLSRMGNRFIVLITNNNAKAENA